MGNDAKKVASVLADVLSGTRLVQHADKAMGEMRFSLWVFHRRVIKLPLPGVSERYGSKPQEFPGRGQTSEFLFRSLTSTILTAVPNVSIKIG